MEITLGHQRGPCYFIPDGDYPTPPNSTLLIDPDVDCPIKHDIPWADRPLQTGPTQLIKPKCTEPYYTKEALPT